MKIEKYPKIIMTKKEYDVLSEFAKVLSNYCRNDVVFCKDCGIYEWCHDSNPRNGNSWSELLSQLRCQDVLIITDEPKANWHALSGDAQILNKPTIASEESIVNSKYFFDRD